MGLLSKLGGAVKEGLRKGAVNGLLKATGNSSATGQVQFSEYWMPSHTRIINKIPPYKKINIDLSKYWNMIQSNNESKLSDLKITKENMLDSELIELNYVNGKAKVQSRINDTTYEVPFKYLDETVNVSDEMILSNSFITKYNEL